MAHGRSNESYVIFNGVKSADLGIRVLKSPVFPVAASVGNIVSVYGRNGFLWYPNGTYGSVSGKGEYIVPISSTTDMNAIRKWFVGEGKITCSDDKDYERFVVIDEASKFSYIGRNFMKVTAEYQAQPFKYLRSESPIIINSSRTEIGHNGNVDSEPIVYITGTGDVTVTINDVTMSVSGLTGATGEIVCIDCEARMATKTTSTTKSNISIEIEPSGEWYKLSSSNTNVVEKSSGVVGLQIKPRWRWL